MEMNKNKVDRFTALPSAVDNLLRKELLQLSITDRNAIFEEVHGVSTSAPEETPQFLEDALSRLSEELDKIPNNNPSKAAYLGSQRFVLTYVNSNDFRLRFLRCELFDAKKAASRMIAFLYIASHLFGSDVLRRPMRITDLSKEEEKLCRVGYLQVLPYRDRAGRPIVAWVGDFDVKEGTDENRARIALYITYALTDDIESQRRGFVKITLIGSNTVATPNPMKIVRTVKLFTKVTEGLPIRLCSIHFCMPDKQVYHVLRSMYTLSLFPNRQRMKFHIGEETQLFYALQSYGIPVELIPVTGTGNIKTNYWKQWMKTRDHMENVRETGPQIPIIVCPRSNDIIFRTGTALTCHPGNVMFQSIIESKVTMHSAASQVEKFEITEKIIDQLQQRKGRFLIWNADGYWTELKDPSQIHAKVANSVRDFKRKTVAMQHRQNPQCSTSMFRNQDGKRKRFSIGKNC